MAASATASGAPKLCYSASQYGHSKPATKRAMGTIKFYIQNNVNFPRRSAQRSFPIRALDPQRGEEEEQEDSSKNNKTGAFTSQVTCLSPSFFDLSTLFLWAKFSFVFRHPLCRFLWCRFRTFTSLTLNFRNESCIIAYPLFWVCDIFL